MKQPAPDLIVAGKYCLERQLAAGGMGSVWVARHLDLDKDVAVKFMDPECASVDGRKRFELEAKAAFHLQSPYVVNILDYGIDAELPYIAMELLEGEDLEDRLQREGRISLEEAAKILMQAAKALRRAQELGIVHRDIKPHNMFLAKGDDDNDETLKILDFGIAKEMGPALVGEGTNTGHIVGSPNYMSPEHVRGARDIDWRSDLWSLGVVTFQAVTGRLPFPGDVVGDVIGMILADPIPRATEIAPDLPPAIDDFFFKALQRDRSLRFQSAREMSEAFAEMVRLSLPPSLRPPPPLKPSSAGETPQPRAVAETIDAAAPTPPPAAAAAAAAATAESAPAPQPVDNASASALTTQISGEDTLAKGAVTDTKPRAKRDGWKLGLYAAASAVVIAGGALIFLLRVPGSPTENGASAPSGSAVAESAPPQGQTPPAATAAKEGAQPETAGSTQAASADGVAGRQHAATGQQGGARGEERAQGAQSAEPAATAPAPSESATAAAPTHVTNTPAFELGEPTSGNKTQAASAGAKLPASSKPTSTTKPTTKTSSGAPSWGF